jgi:hypothetical protein
MDPSFLERFAIFSREQQHTQQSSSTDGGNVNLVSYVEYQKNYRWGGSAGGGGSIWTSRHLCERQPQA